ncbi:class I SAM-dependent methyltransferase [Allokutzneria oryzae]|uniref:Class I SAM-dependent methyltransferase n=1 Tax=Allokutzneria oryzae TaxID=1378989 RepID=A0ABV5ZTF2_9PSEU
MFVTDDADIYDMVYRGRGKDFAQEARDTLGLVTARRGSVTSLLDVACGTGAHLATFLAEVGDVEGLELSNAMIKHARKLLPDSVPLHETDMRSFDLGRKFDAVVSLFSSVGYLKTEQDLRDALKCMGDHLEPGGVIVIEPWWFPDTYTSGWVAGDIIREGEYTIGRVSHAVRDGGVSRMQVHYTVATPEGSRYFLDEHECTLFTREQYDNAFAAAGFVDLEFIQGREPARPVGLFVGTRA